MDADTLKKKLQKQNPLMMSPMAFALAACGGGGAEEEITPSLSGVRTLSPTGDDLLDLMTSGSYYRTTPANPLFYGLAHGHYGERWEDPEKVAEVLKDVMNEFDEYADISLQYAGIFDSPNAASDAGVSIVLSFDKYIFAANDATTPFYSYYPATTQEQLEMDFGLNSIGGDSYLNFSSPNWAAESQQDFETILTSTDGGFAVLLHAMALTIGLKSTYSSSNERPTIEDTRFAGDAETIEFSVSHASYDTIGDATEVIPTLGILDILALMSLYGPNPTTNDTDDIYNLANTVKFDVIYDAAGIDTISFNDSAETIIAMLPNEEFTKDAYGNTPELDVGVFIIEPGAVDPVNGFLIGDIENVITGFGDDTIIGNNLDNEITSGSGDDMIMLSRGDDIVYGGQGVDTFIAQGAMGSFYFLGDNTVIKDFEVGIDTLTVADGSMELNYSRNEDGYATYTNDAGVYVVLEGIEANVLLIA